MSTKIWTAYRLKKNSDLWNVLHDTRVKATENIRKVLRGLCLNIAAGAEGTEEYKTFMREGGYSTSSDRSRLAYASWALRKRYMDQILSSLRDTYNFDVWVSVRKYKGVTCLIPHADDMLRRVLDFMEKDPRLADWHYQDQVKPDEAEEKDPKDWKRRRKFYDEVTREDPWKDKLLLVLCDKDHYMDVDPRRQLLEELREREQKDEHTTA